MTVELDPPVKSQLPGVMSVCGLEECFSSCIEYGRLTMWLGGALLFQCMRELGTVSHMPTPIFKTYMALKTQSRRNAVSIKW